MPCGITGVDRPKSRKFLGLRVLSSGRNTFLGIHPKSVQQAKNKARQITKRNRGGVLTELFASIGVLWTARRHIIDIAGASVF
jgi:hypothetical protein